MAVGIIKMGHGIGAMFRNGPPQLLVIKERK